MYWPLFLFPVKQGYASKQLRAFGLTLFSVSSEEAAWPSGQRVRLVVISRSQVRVRPWPLAGFFSQSSRVQILGHACKYSTRCLLPVWVFNPVMLCLNYLFPSIRVECL